MNGNDYIKALSENICIFRKKAELTQDTLAEKLDVTFQAVSKWENGLSSPDMMLLPQLADIFNVTIDELFSRDTPNPQQATTLVGLPWANDDTIHGAVYKGHKLLKPCDEISKFTFEYKGEALNVESSCSISCRDIEGNVNAGCDVNCDTISNNAKSGCNIKCGCINGDANAGCDINCEEINGNTNAWYGIKCQEVHGNATCHGDLNCDSIGGDVECHGDLNCDSIDGVQKNQ